MSEAEQAGVEIEITLPTLLQDYAEGQRTLFVKAKTVQGCIDALLKRFPLMKRHLFTEQGDQRPHVLFFYNEENTRWLKSLDIPISAGDTFTIVQAVSGG